MPVRLAINGLGRIGRSALRVAVDRDDVEVVAVNDLAPPAALAYLLRYDSVLGTWEIPVEAREGALAIGARDVPALREEDPSRLPWADLNVDVVLECTGAHTARAAAARHLQAGAARVVISASSDDADVTLVRGVNEDHFDPVRHRVVSNGSCTGNCLAPALRVLDDAFGVAHGFVTTIHPYTGEQSLLDRPSADPRRGRAAALSIFPTVTGVPRAIAQVLPGFAGRLEGNSIRVPTPDVCLLDLTAALRRPAPVASVNAALRAAAEGPLHGILGYTEEPLVSADYVGCPLSAVVDGPQTSRAGPDLVKVLLWCDNEWGYANRLVELAQHVGRG
ncbi:MAG: type I glyceraldehyde-3-phosphate dehydrogenase [Proteobacteria bacterium]|nr:type I glyceraldehyde-3-phosphate dehydrogenase [Pseudomonadota bacterium]